jgi:uncharacterized protein (PEP-CTERM system associated)
MCVVTVPLGIPARLSCAVAVGCLLGGPGALAFPLTDPSTPSIVTNAPEPTDSDLRNQLQLHSGFGAAAAGGGWTFTPTISLQEAWTDNILNTTNNRRWDILTLVTPSIAITGDVPNAQVQFQYGPQFRLAARTPEENGITNQLMGTGLFTIVPDEFYVDARAFAGGSPIGGGFGALGPGITQNFGGFSNPTSLGTTGLSARNQVQTSSVSIAPYWLHRFGDTGTAKIGYQINESNFSQGNNYVPIFFPTGSNTGYNVTNEGVAQFETGDRFAPFRNLTIADAVIGNGNFQGNSRQYTFINQLGYLVNSDITVFGQLGYESLQFDGIPPTRIDDIIWGVGTTWTPNPDSQITVTFGHRYGENNFGLNGSYALTTRTHISAYYTTGIQNDLQNLQGQLDLASLLSTGQTVNSQTGAPLFIGNGGLGFQSGLFRTKSFTASINTALDRDLFGVSLQVSQSTTLSAPPLGSVVVVNVPTAPVGSTSNSKSIYGTWTHQISEDLTLSSTASFSTSHIGGSSGGNQQSWAINIGMQYLITQTLAATVSYSFFDYLTSAQNILFRNRSQQNQSFYQNLVIVGLTKQF